ncbi:MAG: hypothetical protein DLM63_12640 [Solirubrobacterales bacterium]|nr:MAG: hypothetical protein DLM63_12640 [Solirubrobacterales bacterium]
MWLPTQVEWRLQSAVSRVCDSGGIRTMHELAVAIAATGRRVEIRGGVDFGELELLGAAAGAMPELPTRPRRAGPDDVVLVPEGLADPLSFAPTVLSGARQILVLLAPTGLFGWPFVDGWSPMPPLAVPIDAVARPDHFRAMSALGFELWTHMPRLAEEAKAAGVDCTYIGNGRPLAYPPPLPKAYDVATLAQNRWAELARSVSTKLDPTVRCHEIAPGSNEEVLRAMGQTRVLVHPSRIEGHSRIGQEARAMGAVPVVLDSNPYAVGLDDAGGAVLAPSLEEMPRVVTDLLRDPERLRRLRERGMKTARAQVDWDEYVGRVDVALARPPSADPARGARRAIGERLTQREDLLRKEITVRIEESERLHEDHETLRQKLHQLQSTRAWRVARVYWLARDRIRLAVVGARRLRRRDADHG